MTDPALPPATAQALADVLRRRLDGLRLAYCFGSVPRGDAHAESDLDVAVLMGRSLEPLELLDLRRELSVAAGREVDLVDLCRAPSALKVRVIDGVVLFERTTATREAYEARTLGEFVRLEESRRGIVEDALARGSVHG